jgi:hypothetical protein
MREHAAKLESVKERIATETNFLMSLPERVTPVPNLNLPSKPGVMPIRDDIAKQ